jgi:hypothetical protein
MINVFSPSKKDNGKSPRKGVRAFWKTEEGNPEAKSRFFRYAPVVSRPSGRPSSRALLKAEGHSPMGYRPLALSKKGSDY